MKNSTIALAVAAALGVSAAAQAETTLYGSARVSADYFHPGADRLFSRLFKLSGADVWEVHDDASRLGVKGSEDLGAGLSAIYNFELGVDVTGGSNYFASNRPRWVGLKGPFGSVALGTQWTPYYNVIGVTDQFNSNLTYDDYALVSSATKNRAFGTTVAPPVPPMLFVKGVGEKRRSNSFIYSTPDLYGFGAQIGVQMDALGTSSNPGSNSSSTSRSVDAVEGNITYKYGPFFAGATFVQARKFAYFTTFGTLPLNSIPLSSARGDDRNYGVALGYNPGPWSVGFSWQQYDPDHTNPVMLNVDKKGVLTSFLLGKREINDYTIGGSYGFGNTITRLNFSYLNVDLPSSVGNADIYFVEAGIQQNLSKRTRVWGEYIYANQNLDFLNAQFHPTRTSAVSIGVRHDF